MPYNLILSQFFIAQLLETIWHNFANVQIQTRELMNYSNNTL